MTPPAPLRGARAALEEDDAHAMPGLSLVLQSVAGVVLVQRTSGRDADPRESGRAVPRLRGRDDRRGDAEAVGGGAGEGGGGERKEEVTTMGATSIEWTDYSWNPIRARGPEQKLGHYCERISSGCANCYSSRFQPRFGLPQFPGPNTHVKGKSIVEPFLDEARLREPLSWRKPRKVFVCDMTDLFGNWVPDQWIDRIFAVFALTPHITYQVLTKRPERMAECLSRGVVPIQNAVDDSETWDASPVAADAHAPLVQWPLPNVWLGTSVEDQQRADRRIPHLLRCPAAVRFLSCEPLLGPINLAGTRDPVRRTTSGAYLGPCLHAGEQGGLYETPGVDWVIVGCESGGGRRPMDLAWARSIRDQCRAAGVAFFCKQLEVGGRVTDDVTQFPPDLRVQQFPASTATTLASHA